MKIYDYFDFISESKLELLLESKMYFTPKFTEFLHDIKSPISDKLLNIVNKDIGVNVNFIDVDLTKSDVATFVPDSKLNQKTIFVNSNHEFYDLAKKGKDLGIFNIKNPHRIAPNTEGEIIKEFSLVDIINFYPDKNEYVVLDHYRSKFDNYGPLVHFRFKVDLVGMCDTIVYKNGLMIKHDIGDTVKSEIKIGRFVKRILDKAGLPATDKEIEDFVNKYKSLVNITNDAFLRFKEVKGEDIRKYYNHLKYDNGAGTLGNSCMRYDVAQKFLDIYVENPEKISLVIFISKNIVSDKISGRAILWSDDRDRKFMDRIYINNDADEELFKEYAKRHGYLYKVKQSYGDNNLLLNDLPLSDSDNVVTIELKPKEYEFYPYMDTVKYYSPKIGIISTNNVTIFNRHNLIELRGTNGTFRTIRDRF